MGRAEHGADVRAPSWTRAREPASPACETLWQKASKLCKSHLSRCHTHSHSVLRASPCRDLGRPQSGLALAGRIDAARPRRGGFAIVDVAPRLRDVIYQ